VVDDVKQRPPEADPAVGTVFRQRENPVVDGATPRQLVASSTSRCRRPAADCLRDLRSLSVRGGEDVTYCGSPLLVVGI
jgi:hypothetical protein